jgi:two-component system sensor histidine kinase RpfC
MKSHLNTAIHRTVAFLRQWVANELAPATTREPAPQSTPGLRAWTTREGLAGLKAKCDREEFNQAKVRVAIAGLVVIYLAYLAWYVGGPGEETAPEHHVEVLIIAITFFLFSCLLVFRILFAGSPSVRRRFLGMVVDNAVTTYCLIRLGEGSAVIIGVYLFITFGNGLRYGRLYLYACQTMAVAGFGLVLTESNYWSHSIYVGFFIALIILPVYVAKLSQKIKEAKKRADDANQAKGRFLANMSHEMRTPLNGVIAMADVLRETSLSESQREIVDTLGTSAHLLLAQIEDVLDMAKIEAGRVQIEQQPFDLGHLLSSTVKVVLPQARYKGLAVNTEIAPAAARWFAGDSHHLRQVLLNLLANAVKFTERGQITLRVGVSDVDPRFVRFEVEDTGIGISPDKQIAIFEPFAQADDSITRLYGGTGLGTAIARQLVTLMGGQIGVNSAVGSGSTFWFELPLLRAEPTGIDLRAEIAASARLSSTAAAFAAQQPAKVTKIRGARVLVAEDNPTNQRVTQLILESGGHNVTIVDNGEKALDELEHGNFDIALFDLSMPVVSGIEALKLYQFTTSTPIPVLILSANVTTGIIADCQRAGCAEFLPKPIRATLLLDAIERHLAETAHDLKSLAPPVRSEERPALTIIDSPVVDPSVLEDLGRLSTDSTFVERLLRGFQADSDRLIRTISDGLAARRYEDVKDAAHALKGGAGSVGATQLMQLAVRLEKASYDTLRVRAAPWMEELARASSATQAALERHLEERRKRSSLS